MPASNPDSHARLQWGLLLSLLLHLFVLSGLVAGVGEKARQPKAVLDVMLVDRPGIATQEAADLAAASNIALSPVEDAKPVPPAGSPPPAADIAAEDDKEGAGAASAQPVFLPSKGLDRPPMPISAPDPRKYLAGSDFPTVSFKVRLYIDALGTVVNVEADGAAALLDDHQLEKVKRMFYATTFIPGNLGGRDVASYKDIVVDMLDPVS